MGNKGERSPWTSALVGALVAAACGGEGAAPPPRSEEPSSPGPPRATAAASADEPAPRPAAEAEAPEEARSAEPPAPPPPDPPPPLVQRPVEIDEVDGWPIVDPALRGATRIGQGPWLSDMALAIAAGWARVGEDEPVEVVAQLDHRGATLALVTVLSSPADREIPDLYSLWLARVEHRTTPEGETEHRRTAVVRLYEGAMASSELSLPEHDCQADRSELRARDVDGDGEVEVTVIAAYLQPTQDRSQGGGGQPDECGAVAFLVGLDDWNVQASFTREYAINAFAASIEVGEYRSAAWQLRDVNGDGHADLHVVERWRFIDDFMGDYVGEDESMPPSRRRGSDRRELDCLYEPAADAWRCDDPPPGRLLFEDPTRRAARFGHRPW